MLQKVAGLFIGIFLIFGGVQVFFQRGHRSVMWGRWIDYGAYHQVIGVIVMFVGLFIAYKEIRFLISGRRRG